MRHNSLIYELAFHIDSTKAYRTEIVKKLLNNAGFAPTSIVETAFGLATTIAVYETQRAKFNPLLAQLKRHPKVQYQLKQLRPKDWRDRWKEVFKPFAITQSIDIVPEKDRKKYKRNKRTPIYLDTTTAFGTGMHETTRFMSELIESRRNQFADFFDIGTGTGILALVALVCGAKRVKAVDIDKQAVIIARDNFRRNNYNPAVVTKADIGKVLSKRQYDFVGANLITDELLRLRNTILEYVKPAGWLAVSGVSMANLPGFLKRFSGRGLRCKKIIRGENWSAMLYQKEK